MARSGVGILLDEAFLGGGASQARLAACVGHATRADPDATTAPSAPRRRTPTTGRSGSGGVARWARTT